VKEFLARIDAQVEKVEALDRLSADPVVSVWMITYNHEIYIRQALDSILMQEVDFDYEVVIGEDKSTDRTREIVIEYQKQHPDKIRLRLARENLRSQGLKPGIAVRAACRGKYIAMLEGDDYWTDPLKLQKQVDFLEKNPEYVICYTDAVSVNQANGLYTSVLLEHHKVDYTQEELIRNRTYIKTCTICFKNVILQKSYPPEFCKVKSGDNLLTSMLGQYGKGAYLADVQPSVYRKHEGGVFSLLSETDKNESRLIRDYWMFQYYKRVGEPSHANSYLNRIIDMAKNWRIALPNEETACESVKTKKIPRLLRAVKRVLRALHACWQILRYG
jgi:glycosyltransferase involved in cell wall biosynthesis